MKKLNYLQAAWLYYLLWNIEEYTMEEDELQGLREYMRFRLKSGGWPSDPIYDNDAEPMIDWQSFGAPREFNYLDTHQQPDNDEEIFKAPYRQFWDTLCDNDTYETLESQLEQLKP